MSQKTKNLFLLKSLLHSDFLISNKKTHLKLESKTIFSKYSIKNSSYSILEPLELLKSLKQFIRVLQFLKQQKMPLLEIGVRNAQITSLINNFFQTNHLSLPIIISQTSNIKKLNQSKLTLLIENLFLNQFSAFKTGFGNEFNLITKINSLKTTSDWYAYKINNDLDNIKKIVFLLIIIRQIYTKSA